MTAIINSNMQQENYDKTKADGDSHKPNTSKISRLRMSIYIAIGLITDSGFATLVLQVALAG